MKQKKANSKDGAYQKKSVFFDIGLSKINIDLLKKIVLELGENYLVNISCEDDLSNLISQFSVNNLFAINPNNVKQTDMVLNKSQYIITDKCFSASFKPKKGQIAIFICTNSNHNYNYQDMQRTFRDSSYNIFLSEDYAQNQLTKFGVNYLLKQKNIICDIDNRGEVILNLLKNNILNNQFLDSNKEDNILIFIDKINNEHQEAMILDYLNQLDGKYHYFIFSLGLSNKDLIDKCSNNIQYITYSKSHYSFLERIILNLSIRSKILDYLLKKYTHIFFAREMNKKINGYHFNQIISLFDTTRYTCRELETIKCFKQFAIMDNVYTGILAMRKWYKNNVIFKKKNYDNFILIDKLVYGHNTSTFYNSCVEFYRCHTLINKDKKCVNFKLYFKKKILFKIDYSLCCLYLGDVKINSDIKKGLLFDKIKFSINRDDIVALPTQNKLFLSYLDNHNLGFKKDIFYKRVYSRKQDYLKSTIININGKTSCYLRQSQKNRVYLTVRRFNRTDSFIENLKINLAFYISCFIKDNRMCLLFEKDSSRYEESASVLYEKLLDKGYESVYFILDRSYQDFDIIKDKYKKNIIEKYSFKHYLYFFVSQTFCGSELLVHSMELRIMNKHVLRKIYSSDINYVFLQHGVMYMISLDSDSRKYFTPRKDGKGKYRVVTSSREETKHFVELGGYNPNQLITCGLPKYDRNMLCEDANKIVIMPTWRPWEYNIAITDFKMTKYYQMLERIVNSIDKKYQNNIVVLPHPLFYEAAKDNDFALKKYMMFNVKYDEILRNTRVLITDYSSIAFDAFYRGSRVIFYWEELDECLQKYGNHTKLMLNKSNVFGDICFNADDLSNIIEENYDKPQKSEFLIRYNKLVEFHDGKNTERLIEYLENEKIIS